MGYGEVVASMGSGRYLLKLDFGDYKRRALVDAYNLLIGQLNAKMLEADVAIAAGEELEAIALAEVVSLVEDCVLAAQEGNTAAAAIANVLLERYRLEYVAINSDTDKNRNQKKKWNVSLTNAARSLRALQDLPVVVNREAWCASLTLGGSGYVRTAEIPGDSSLVLIYPGCPEPVLIRDGYLHARQLMSPEQVYFNEAILPGWQKFFPTFRWGTLTSIDWDENKGNVSLNDERSTAQRLNVNQASSLVAVPITYMASDAKAFTPDERVVVEFTGQSWGSPTIIGYLDNPKGDIPTLTGDRSPVFINYDQPAYLDLSGLFTTSTTVRQYELVSGRFPDGLTLDASTGKAVGVCLEPDGRSDVVVRCGDAHYIKDRNRRYADAKAFQLSWSGYWWTLFYNATYPYGIPDGTPAPLVDWREVQTVPIHTTGGSVTAPDPTTYTVWLCWEDGVMEPTRPGDLAYTNQYPNSTFRGFSAAYKAFATYVVTGVGSVGNSGGPTPFFGYLGYADGSPSGFPGEIISVTQGPNTASVDAAAAWRAPTVTVVHTAEALTYGVRSVTLFYTFGGDLNETNGVYNLVSATSV